MSERIAAEEVRRKIDRGEDLMLVCAYDDDSRCHPPGAAGVRALGEFRDELPRLPRSRQLVFLCA